MTKYLPLKRGETGCQTLNRLEGKPSTLRDAASYIEYYDCKNRDGYFYVIFNPFGKIIGRCFPNTKSRTLMEHYGVPITKVSLETLQSYDDFPWFQDVPLGEAVYPDDEGGL